MVWRSGRRVIEGARTLLVQSGLDTKWWPQPVRHFATAWNAEDFGDGSPCLVDFVSTPAKASSEPKFGPKAVPGLFLGWHLAQRCKWKGDYLVVDLRDVKDNPESASVHVQRLKEVYHKSKVAPCSCTAPFYPNSPKPQLKPLSP